MVIIWVFDGRGGWSATRYLDSACTCTDDRRSRATLLSSLLLFRFCVSFDIGLARPRRAFFFFCSTCRLT